MAIQINAYDARARYARLSAELCGLPPDCERTAEIRYQQRQIERLHPELEQTRVDAMAAQLQADHRMIGDSEAPTK